MINKSALTLIKLNLYSFEDAHVHESRELFDLSRKDLMVRATMHVIIPYTTHYCATTVSGWARETFPESKEKYNITLIKLNSTQCNAR